MATISSTGVVYAISSGYVDILYYLSAVCSTSITESIPATVFIDTTLSGPAVLCSGSSGTYSSWPSGGTWSTSTTTIATVISATGVVTGISAGTASLTYTVAGPCGPASNVFTITISTTTSTGTITGSSVGYVGSGTTLTDPIAGGTWEQQQHTSIASVNTSTGYVSGVAAGTATITYTVSGCGGPAYTTFPVTVSVLNRISGGVNFSTTDSIFGTVKVWLITYNPATLDLEAVDSVIMTSAGGSFLSYYEFLSKPTDSYRVKAAYFPPVFSPTGYVPTYHTSSFYWHDANVLYHTGYADDGVDINMATGTVVSGPGFIAGNVSMGANKGTSGTVPSTGLLMLLQNTSADVVEQTYTDASGNYSLTNVPYGT